MRRVLSPVLPQLRAVGLGLVMIFGVMTIVTTAGQADEPLDAPTVLSLSLRPFAAGLNQPVGLTNAGDERLFVLERRGVIKIIQADGAVLPTPFLDLMDRVDASHADEGLLGLAFHPDYQDNGYFYLNYTSTITDIRRTRISRFTVSLDPEVADPDSEEILLTVDQPYQIHNGGDLHFAPDGLLYIPLGDGGGSYDPDNNAQQLDRLLGKIVRINVDVDAGAPADCFGVGSGHYTIPLDNPYIDGPSQSCDEIWAAGFRNPWRSSFDRQTGDFYLGDVGQSDWEEIDFYPVDTPGGLNFGWPCYEGTHDSITEDCGPPSWYTAPIFEYGSKNTGHCAVIGGYVYRGSLYPALIGHYLLIDYCSGHLWDLIRRDDHWQATEHANLSATGYVAFGQAAGGELYLIHLDGTIYALQENTLRLSISKSGPQVIRAGERLTYTLTITNGSAITATQLLVTDTLPTSAYYLSGSGGTLIDGVVQWTIPNLTGHSMTQTIFAVTTTETISNVDYRVSTVDDQSAAGTTAVRTVTVQPYTYLPLIAKSGL